MGGGIPILTLIGLLAWASVVTGGNPGGLGTNYEFGQVQVEPEVARGFTLELLDGSILSLSDLRGKIVLLDFWASWCPPCRQEAPDLARVYREYVGQGVEFVGVDIWDHRQDAVDYVAAFAVPYANGVDSKGAIAIDYGVRGIPEKFLINGDGTTVRKFVGPISADTLRAALNDLLAAERTNR